MAAAEDPIHHRARHGRGEFYVEREGRRVAELTYSFNAEDVVVGHTWVDPTLRGAGLAPRLVEEVVRWARGESRRIVPVCSYVRAAFERSPQYDDVWRKL